MDLANDIIHEEMSYFKALIEVKTGIFWSVTGLIVTSLHSEKKL